MAVIRETRQEHNPVEAKSEESEQLAAMLAPLEELEGAMEAGNGERQLRGAIVIDTGKLTLPNGFDEKEKKGAWLREVDPVVILIFALSLLFIVFIAYLIYTGQPAQ